LPRLGPERHRQALATTVVTTATEQASSRGPGADGCAATVRAALWEAHPDITALLRTICRHAEIDLAVVTDAEALIATVNHYRPSDLLIVDCSHGVREDVARCAGVVSSTTRPVYCIHPRPEVLEPLRAIARGTFQVVPPEWFGVSPLEHLRAFRAAISRRAVTGGSAAASQRWDVGHSVAHTGGSSVDGAAITSGRVGLLAAFSNRERDVCELAAKGLTYAEIASHICITLSTVKSHAANAKAKLELGKREKLGPAYRRLMGE